MESLYATSVDISDYLTTNELYASKANIEGTLQAEKVRVAERLCAKAIRITDPPCWPDFVFSKDYELLSLYEVEQFIAENHHLPNVPSAAEVKANGIDLGEMNVILLQKVEELTLYILNLQRQIDELKQTKGGE